MFPLYSRSTAVGILLDPVEVTSASISAGGNLVYDKLLLDPTAVLIWDFRTGMATSCEGTYALFALSCTICYC